jgi:hypothetical protein
MGIIPCARERVKVDASREPGVAGQDELRYRVGYGAGRLPGRGGCKADWGAGAGGKPL